MEQDRRNEESDVGRRAVRWKKITICGVLGILILLGVSYVLFCLGIGSHVKPICAEAMREFPGDKVEAVLGYIESDRYSLKERNKAVWALGYLGDKRALPVLKKHFTGGPCDHDKYLCQGELAKAIKKCESGVNPCAWACR
ncbi:MAG: hypothetical protein ACYS8Z_07280 [Planctomycetota bacterium]|jgi:hypothetical protein